MTLLPKSLAGRLTLLLLLGLLVAQAAAFALFAEERREAVRHVYRETMVARAASLLSLLAETPPAMHERIVEGASTRSLRFWLAEEATVTSRRTHGPAAMVAADLAYRLGLPPERVRVALAPPIRDDDDDDGDDDDDEGGHHMRRARWLALSVALPDGRWLNAATGAPPRPPLGAPFLVSLALSAAAVAGVALLAARALTGPMRRLALAADRLGRGEAVAVAEEGPEEVRRSIRAFNRMQERLERFVKDRTAMLAAISHDLRTPITSLRLRAEFVDDDETRSRILETLDEMQAMTEATLAFAREDAEETRTVDLAALIDSVVADHAELGHAVAFAGAERTLIACRPSALRRAIANLVVNAATYGTRASVRLERDADELRVVIEDEGPGILEHERERVFEPFVRLDPSRSRETGGIGLGLAIARTIVRNHGGDIVLENRNGGLRATVHLPAAA